MMHLRTLWHTQKKSHDETEDSDLEIADGYVSSSIFAVSADIMGTAVEYQVVILFHDHIVDMYLTNNDQASRRNDGDMFP